ncbi:aminoglycoside phosphotransferase family protein [Kytococcus sedentarius]|uniref:aminoglycoside phosphotransferase family protein n=1 Tax=Kytococcus sedentarius TaxID=1276 RepID=UPI0035BBE6F8
MPPERLHPGLSAAQQARLDAWLPGAQLVADQSWTELGQRAVLWVRAGDADLIVKAGFEGDHHMEREITAHERWLAPLVERGRAPQMLHADRAQRMVVTRRLPGELVQGHDAQDQPDTYRQAGELLAVLHGQHVEVDHSFEARENAKSLDWLSRPHRTEEPLAGRLWHLVAGWPAPAVRVVPVHDDAQPRNWLVHQGQVSFIDFGKATLKPAALDLGRLEHQDFARDPALEAAFLEGYGSDPRVEGAPDAGWWSRVQVRGAIGQAVWAHQVGDRAFEDAGLAILRRLLG